jgi:hypothetical protein
MSNAPAANPLANFVERRGRPNLMADEYLLKVQQIVIGSRSAGIPLQHQDIISIGTGVLMANCPHILKEN